MFEDSLIESGGRLRTKRGRTSAIAFFVQICIIVVMILIPLIFTEALPRTQLMTFLVAPPPPPPPPPPAAAPVKIVKVIQTDIVNGQLRTPTKIPQKVQMIKEDEAPPPVMAATGVVGGVPGGVPGGSMGGVIGSVLSSTPVAVPKIATPQRVRVSSGVSQGLLVRRVNPTYPPLARQARIQGVVILQAQISKAGDIENLQLISGHPMLAPAAIEAVKQWKYKPYLLNGEPVEVDTQVQVNFTLSGG
ncbi:MAG TPA: energy transducer TonB [Candidatus Acidoferrales bacterium]|jgi:protein TonB|nr:energy transducer TonB [Candidatus Acidoferrales bacterium]